MKKSHAAGLCITLAIIVLIALDQWLKYYIRTEFRVGETRDILPFFQLVFVENYGMAFGISWLPQWVLVAFRIIMVALLLYYLTMLVRRQNTSVRPTYIAMIVLITAGAIGNIIDFFTYGPVIDMFYFPLIRNAAGEVIFFRPVFNLADSYITVAVFAIILFFTKDLNKSLEKSEK